jgi:splicing factor U2AF subunit
MADRLASIYGTERDKVNCSFYFKIGACRHGDECSRKHVKPLYSQTILIPNLFLNPVHILKDRDFDPAEIDRIFCAFWEDLFTEISLCYGEIEDMRVCDNVGDHLMGNVYVKFHREQDAARAVAGINKRFYAGRPMHAELSPVTDFRESCCRQHDIGECMRGGFCNFMHVRRPPKELERSLYASQRVSLRARK